MTDFGLRSQSDAEFKKVYREVKKDFCQRILDDDEFAAKYGNFG